MTAITILGNPTQTTELISGSFPCNGIILGEINRNVIFPTRVPCTGLSYLVGNDTYEITLAGDRNETLDLFGPQTFSAYINGYQMFTQFAPITTGTCIGGFFLTVQLLYPRYYPGCLPPFGLQRAESYYTYIRIQGGPCQAECQGYININFEPSVVANYV